MKLSPIEDQLESLLRWASQKGDSAYEAAYKILSNDFLGPIALVSIIASAVIAIICWIFTH